ncbi:MAG: GGDEF domain-containing protein [Sulfurospirillaceae bacterium]|nr:GGDEF domain-containing protein [Sulfurospirillaceae bacterium]
MQKKILLVILGTIFVAFAIIVVFSSISIRDFGIKGAEEKAQIAAELVQDGLTAHMLSGTMDNREFFLKKIENSKNIESLWLSRSESVIKQFDKGFNNEVARDEIDKKVLKNGIVHKEIVETSRDAKLRITIPYVATAHTNPNCMTCHNAKEGEVLGTVSMVLNISDVRYNGFVITSVILGISIIILFIVFFIITRSMKPLSSLFESINFVMSSAQKGDYSKRISSRSKELEYQNIASWINSLLSKIETTLQEIENVAGRFLSKKEYQHSDMLIEVRDMIHELSDIYKFKNTIEFDEDKKQVYARIGLILSSKFGLNNFSLAESINTNHAPQIVYSKGSLASDIGSNCRALRIKQMVHSEQFPNICETCSKSTEHYVCIPYTISDGFEILLNIAFDKKEDVEKTIKNIPRLQNYIDSARPELVSKNLTEILRFSSTVDSLTGLFNRKYLDEYVEKIMAQSLRTKISYGILMIDIDYFKMVNDNYGHDVGDNAIRILSATLKENIREADMAFRFGGEEFLILLHNCEEGSSVVVAEKIRQAFEKKAIKAPNSKEFYKTLSVGVSDFPKDGDTIWKCIKFADIALYDAKHNGRNCVKKFDYSTMEDKKNKDF